MSEVAAEPSHTEHALLVLLGRYAQHLGLIQAMMSAPCIRRPARISHRPRWSSFWWLFWLACPISRISVVMRGRWTRSGCGDCLAAGRLGRLQWRWAHLTNAHLTGSGADCRCLKSDQPSLH